MTTESTTDPIRDRAQLRFDRIRAGTTASIVDGTLARQIDDGRFTTPPGPCVSCIARVRSNAPRIVSALGELQNAIAETGDCYLYPPDSIHVSLLALTQREQIPEFDPARIGRLVEAARRSLATTNPSDVRLGALNLLGNQWFVEVFPADDTWAVARRRMAEAARAIGEEPISFPDTEPVHLNMARVNTRLQAPSALTLLALDRSGDDPVVRRHSGD
jgi:hypothetical protein